MISKMANALKFWHLKLLCCLIIMGECGKSHGQSEQVSTTGTIPITVPLLDGTATPTIALYKLQSEVADFRSDDVVRQEPELLVAAVWSSGTIIWSEALDSGGAPYRVTTVDPELVHSATQEIQNLFATSGTLLLTNWTIGHYGQRMAVLFEDGRGLELSSSHPSFDSAGKDFVTLIERVPLPNTRTTTKAEQREETRNEFAKFRSYWNEIRRILVDLIPASGGNVISNGRNRHFSPTRPSFRC